MTVNALPPVPDVNSLIVNGQPSPVFLEYLNALQRQGNELRTAIAALEAQDGVLAAGIDAIDVTQESDPGRVFISSSAATSSMAFTDLPSGYSAFELIYAGVSSTAGGLVTVGIDDANGASYVSATIGSLADNFASTSGVLLVRRVSEVGVNKVYSDTGNNAAGVLAELGVINAIRITTASSADAGNLYLFGLV